MSTSFVLISAILLDAAAGLETHICIPRCSVIPRLDDSHPAVISIQI